MSRESDALVAQMKRLTDDWVCLGKGVYSFRMDEGMVIVSPEKVYRFDSQPMELSPDDYLKSLNLTDSGQE